MISRRLKIIIKSKLNKKRRRNHIKQLENELGIKNVEKSCTRKNCLTDNSIKNSLLPDNRTEMRRFFDGKLYKKGDEEIADEIVEQYRKINTLFNPEYRVELSTMNGIPYAVIRTVCGAIRAHIYISTDYSMIIYGDIEEFSDVSKKLDDEGYEVEFCSRVCYDFCGR